jgi:hypothetical protein
VSKKPALIERRLSQWLLLRQRLAAEPRLSCH